MTAAEVAAFLAAAGEVVVASVGADGWPIATVASARATSTRIEVDTLGLPEGTAVCCVADIGPSYFEIKGVIARGRVTDATTVAVENVISFDFGKLPEAGS